MSIIPPKSGTSLVVNRGDILRVTDVDGSQVADLVCFNLHSHSEYFSQSETRIHNGTIRISTGHTLFSNRINPMFKIVDDTVGMHDLLYGPCNRYLYENIFKVGPRNGCFENLGIALEPHGIDKESVPDPFNVFMHTDIDEEYGMSIKKPLSKKGDYIDLQAEMDCLVAISSCAEDISDVNNKNCTSIGVEVSFFDVIVKKCAI